MRGFVLHRQAEAELRAAAQWYRSHSPAAASGFVEAVERALRAITENPEAWPRRNPREDVRSFVLERDPFPVVYRVTAEPTPIRVLAIAHARRRPDYWARRR
ncbi:MAG: type II toxin-antitoxin system RelE/ParE family toxin [Deltaproteobacteria bacterium]|nr:type II toxin-antitoxin system RelE/ParE family toxin [Deltaproteobacteria bacterium]